MPPSELRRFFATEVLERGAVGSILPATKRNRYMTWEQKYPILKRVKSLLWRAAMMGLATMAAFLLDNVNMLELSPGWTVFAGLVLGEVSKWLNGRS